MQTLLDFGVSFVVALQSMGDWMIPVMKFFSELGTEEFFFLALPLIYWCIDSALGFRVGLILLSSNYVSFIAKAAMAGPRPYWVSSHVRPLWAESSFGAPSGHAQHAMSVWGIIAVYIKKSWVTVVCVILIFMIGFSRLVLGAHFPHDVVLGWLFGGILLWAFSHYWDAAAKWLKRKTFAQQVGISFWIALGMIVFGLLTAFLRKGYQLPEEWMINALRSGIEPVLVDPDTIFTTAGTFFGLAIGAAWIHSLGGYQAQGPFWKRALRYVIGLIGVVILWQGLGAVFPDGDGVLDYSLRFLRYTLVGWWISGGALWIFQHFNLTTVDRGSSEATSI